eukprot:3678507-Prymnesium_polylepis.2
MINAKAPRAPWPVPARDHRPTVARVLACPLSRASLRARPSDRARHTVHTVHVICPHACAGGPAAAPQPLHRHAPTLRHRQPRPRRRRRRRLRLRLAARAAARAGVRRRRRQRRRHHPAAGGACDAWGRAGGNRAVGTRGGAAHARAARGRAVTRSDE